MKWRSRANRFALGCTAISLLLLVLSSVSETLVNWIFGLDTHEQVSLRDICSAVAIASLIFSALLNQRGNRDDDRNNRR